jgi:hypothetical protein
MAKPKDLITKSFCRLPLRCDRVSYEKGHIAVSGRQEKPKSAWLRKQPFVIDNAYGNIPQPRRHVAINLR